MLNAISKAAIIRGFISFWLFIAHYINNYSEPILQQQQSSENYLTKWSFSSVLLFMMSNISQDAMLIRISNFCTLIVLQISLFLLTHFSVIFNPNICNLMKKSVVRPRRRCRAPEYEITLDWIAALCSLVTGVLTGACITETPARLQPTVELQQIV